ncbi:MAG TPA: aminoacyl-histidine dipeptidase [Bacteroidaceae bacterium]|nr:aminoacyl-histidine dipeptidase [Bacteroidaceae bacterium]
MSDITGLQPAEVWKYFNEILAIPRISKKEDKIISYLKDFAGKHNLESKTDRAGNLLIRKNANPGMENRKGVILQSHVDMVGEKHYDVKHDFNRDPISAYIDNGWIKARGTTLGADDGIGIAVSLAILASDEVVHGPLECLFTVDEESGMTGAFGLQPGFLSGTILLNLDSEDEGEIFIGCAGGVDTIGRLGLRPKRLIKNQASFRVIVNGLKGGHSGDEIHKGFGNSIKILTRFLWNAERRFKIRVSSLSGGKARNAIPREAEALFTLSQGKSELLKVYFASFFETIRKEIENIEPDFMMKLEEADVPESVISKNIQNRLLNLLYAIPNGVITWSHDIEGLVETSTNLASVKLISHDLMEVITSQRSSVESAKRDIADRVESLFLLAKAEVIHSAGYPGWKPDMDSEILNISRKIYYDLFNRNPEVKAIHAGLECGLFLEKYPELDMISFGPTIKGAHTPDERMSIDTVKKFWAFLLAILKEVPAV